MDSITHALIIAIVLTLAGRPDLAVYGILGAVLIDLDVAFGLFSGRDPRLYIFTHGGFTHSFAGALLITVFASIVGFLLSLALPSVMAPFGIMAIMAAGLGALSHLAADLLAYPGIPLLYPLSDKKFTLGIFGGPSVYIMVASIVYAVVILAGMATIQSPWYYVAFFLLAVGVGVLTKAFMALKTRGRTIGTIDPLRWLVIEDGPEDYRFYEYDLLYGISNPESYKKYVGLTPEEAKAAESRPDVRRMKYNSYVVTVEKKDGVITYRDPVREKGHIWYPPQYKTLDVAAE